MERIEEHVKKQSHMDVLRKKLVVSGSCLAICLVLLLSLSLMQYKTPEMRGKVTYEPALFNTVLLGKLAEADINRLQSMTPATYTLVNPYDSENSSLQQRVTGKKAMTSLSVSPSTELGDKQATGEFSKVAPGDTQSAYVPFAITNGTTVADDEDNEKRTKNVAESDIRYTIHVITTENLPLTYQIKDVETGNVYSLQLHHEGDGEATGEYKDYIIQDSATETAPLFRDGSRILKWNDDGSITVHRYQLMVSWLPRAGENNLASSDLKYMKELENVEIRVEVESFVNYIDKSAEQQAENKAEGLMVIKGSPVSDSFYQLKGISETIHAQKVVRLDNLIPDRIYLNDAERKGDYTFHVCNGDAIEGSWNETTKTYVDSGTYESGNYGVLVAVPKGVLNKSSTFPADSSVKLTYNGVEYTGEILQDTNEKKIGVFTDKHEKIQIEGSKKYKYETNSVKAYDLIRFYRTISGEGENAVKEEFKISMSGTQFQTADLKLTFQGSIVPVTKTKGDFRIYVYKEIQATPTE